MNTKASAEAFAPATMGNVGVGFDVLGLAFQDIGDHVRVIARDEPGASMLSISGDGGELPLESTKNTASVAANALLQQIDADHGVWIELHKNLPLASGLGSSAASAVAAVVAVNELFGKRLPKEALLAACLEGEAVVSGYHADNVAPSLLGGIVIVSGDASQDVYSLPVPANLHFALVTPAIAVPTVKARAALPDNVSLHDMVTQTRMVARLVDALYRQDIQAIGDAMEGDVVIEPARAHLIPHLRTARETAKRAGAAGLVISGAGPTLCAVCDSVKAAQLVASSVEDVYHNAGVDVVSRYTRVDSEGARITGLYL